MTDPNPHNGAGVTPRQRLRELADELWDPEGDVASIQIPVLVDQLTALIDMEQMTRQPIVREFVEAWLRQFVQQRVARTRGLIVYGTEIINRQELEKRVAKNASKFEHWMEHVNDSIGHMLLMKMHKHELLEAANERIARGMTEVKYGALWRKLADGMNDTQEVGEVYTSEQLSALADRLHITVRAYDGPSSTLIAEANGGKTVVNPPPVPPATPPKPVGQPEPPTRTPKRSKSAETVRVSVPRNPRPARRS